MAKRGSLALLVSSLAGLNLACAPLQVNKKNSPHPPPGVNVVEVVAEATPPIPPLPISPSPISPLVKFDELTEAAATSTVSNYDKNDRSVDKAIRDEVMAAVQKVSVNFTRRAPSYENTQSTNIGSAIILSGRDGTRYALTANHVIPFNEDLCDDWRSAYSLTVGAKKGRVVFRDCDRDLTIIKLEDSTLPVYNNCLGMEVMPGDYILGAAYGFAGPRAFFDGKVRAAVTPDNPWVHFNGSAVSGESGGPLFAIENKHLQLVGITAFKILDKGDSVGTGGAVGAKNIAEVLKNYSENGRRPLEHYVTGKCAR